MNKKFSNVSENNEPKISVITVVYNDKNNLKNTIESIVEQSYESVEFIIIDGGSTDGTKEIIQENDQYVYYWKSEVDSGIYDAMNKGLHAATGDYVMFLNAGDSFVGREILVKTAKEIIDNNWPDVVYGNANIITENGVFLKELKSLSFTGFNLTLFGTRTVCHQSIVIKRSIAPFYSKYYKLKGELAWYYDIMRSKPKPKIIKLNFPISNYTLGGISDVSFTENIKERLKVIAEKKGVLVSVLAVPALLIPVIFRLKRNLFDRMYRESN